MAAKKKFDFNQAVKKTMIVGATGVGAHVLAEAIDLKDDSIMDYVFLGAGIVLPEVIKNPALEEAGTALTAVGAYRMSQRYDLPGKLGFETTPKASGIPEDYVIGSVDTGKSFWNNARPVYTTEKKNKVANEKQSQQSTVG